MANQDVYEGKEVTASISRRSGTTKNKEVEFEFRKGDKVLATKKETLKEVKDKGANAVAETKYTPPALEPKEASYDITVRHKVDGTVLYERYLTVWPQKGKLTSVDKDGKKALDGFQFKVVQEGKDKVEFRTKGDPAVIEFPLEKKKFKIEALSPYKLYAVLEKGHELKIRGELLFEAEFVAPVSPARGPLRQFVNEATKDNGRDGKGNEVVFRIGVKGDRKKPADKRIGKAGVFAFIKVELGAEGGTRSKRNKPVAELVDGLNLKDKTANGTNKWKAKVELAGPDNTGEFKINLGLAGGDNCTIKIGGTDACKDGTLKIVNWRKLWYETIYPTCLEDMLQSVRPATANDTGMDFPAAIKSKASQRLAAVFVVYDLYRSHKFTKAEAEAVSKTWTTAEFLKAPGKGDRYYATDFTHAKMADGGVPKKFDGNADTKLMRMKLCHRCYEKSAAKVFNWVSSAVNPVELADLARTFLPMNAGDGTESINWGDANNAKWKADVAANKKVKAAVEVVLKSGEGPADTDKKKTVQVREVNQGGSHTVEFVQGAVGNAPTDLSAAAKSALKTWLGGLNAATIKQKGSKAVFEVMGPTGNERQNARLKNIQGYLSAQGPGLLPQIFHAALDDTGKPREGKIDKAWLAFHDVNTMKVTFPKATPADPGSWIGPASDTKAPVKIRIEIVSSKGYNGMVWKQHQLVALRPGADPGSVASTFCHELGHSMGMTIMAGKSKVPPGTPEAKHLDNGGDYYRNDAAADHAKGIRTTHQGSHCAFSLSNAEKALDDIAGSSGSCILWGAGGDADTRPGYCPTCTSYLKARKLVDLRAGWDARGADDY